MDRPGGPPTRTLWMTTVTPMKLLLIEDETKLSEYLKKGLGEEGFVVDTALNGVDGLHMASTNPYDLIVLDGNLPGIDGLAVLTALRQSRQTPVLMLTARVQVEDRVRGLQSGADDYVLKPFAFSELVARIHVLLRRANGSRTGGGGEATVLRLGDLELDLIRRRAVRASQRLDLTAKEFNLLSLLLRRQGEVLSRTELAEQVWDMNFDSDTNVVEVAIRRLRTKLDQPFPLPLLHTVRGMGYVLEQRAT
jgi:two-component system, OmpR family, copper resistance phosphate regulon response regulator CusR